MRVRAAIALISFVAVSAHAATFTVTNTNDSGAGSLRSTVAAAIAAGQSNTVDFAANVTGTILLTSGSIQVPGAVQIAGPGAGILAIDGNANNRIFTIFENAAPPCPALSGPSLYLVTISGLTLTNAQRKTDNSGGAIVSGHSLVLTDVIVQNSQAKNGGGVGFFSQFPGQSLTITNSQFLNNIAKPLSVVTSGNNGGGLKVGENCTGTRTTPVTVTISNSVFSGNSAQPGALNGLNGQGGGIDTNGSYADITIADSRIVNNSVIVPNPPVANQNYRGGGIFATGKSLTIVRSEISGNFTTDVTSSGVTRGGGLGVHNNASDLQGAADVFPVTIVNSTISGNTDSGLGGAIWAYGNVALNIDNSTIAANTAPAGNTGGIRLTTGATNPPTASNATAPTLTLRSSIVANNTADDVATYLATMPTFTLNATNSLFGTICPSPTCEITLSGTGNLVGVNPMLGPLANNGGPTRTQALLGGSPAINAGSNPLSLTTDQRGVGFPRVIGGIADMGAYESNPAAAPMLASAVSRRVHGAAGTFNLPLTLALPVNHNPTTEPRQGPAQTIVFTFDKVINAATVTVTEGSATAASPTFSGNDVVVALTNVTNQQYVTVSLTNVGSSDGSTGGVGSARIGFLTGDVNGTRVISVADLGLVNAQLSQVVTAANYLKDVNASGTLTLADKGITNANLTKALAAP